jgi:hypothetical protein
LRPKKNNCISRKFSEIFFARKKKKKKIPGGITIKNWKRERENREKMGSFGVLFFGEKKRKGTKKNQEKCMGKKTKINGFLCVILVFLRVF